jgi:hypothetical protein
MVFDSIDQAFVFYQNYALSSGFSARKHTDYKHSGVTKIRYFVCSKEGFKHGRVFDTLDDQGKCKTKRRKPSKRCGCKALIKLKLSEDKKYYIREFQEVHNHPFVAHEDMQFLPAMRNVDFVKQNAIDALSSINLGPVRAFNVLKSLYGSAVDLGATKSDFKNYKRDLNKYIGDNDAEMVIQKLMKKSILPKFYS